MEVDINSTIVNRRVWCFKPVNEPVFAEAKLVVIKVKEGYLSLFYRKSRYLTGLPNVHTRVVFSKRFNFEINSATYTEMPFTQEEYESFRKNFQSEPSFYIRDSVSFLFNGVEFRDNTNQYNCSNLRPEFLIYVKNQDGDYDITSGGDERRLEYTYPGQPPFLELTPRPRTENRIVTVLPTEIGCYRDYYEQFKEIVLNLEPEQPEEYDVWLSFTQRSLLSTLSRLRSDTWTATLTKLFDKHLKGMYEKDRVLDTYIDIYSGPSGRLPESSEWLDPDAFSMIIEKRDRSKIWRLTWKRRMSLLNSRVSSEILRIVERIHEYEPRFGQRIVQLEKDEISALFQLLPDTGIQRLDLNPYISGRYESKVQAWRVFEKSVTTLSEVTSLYRTYYHVQVGDESLIVVYQYNRDHSKLIKTIQLPKIEDEQINEIELIGLIQSDCSRNTRSGQNFVVKQYTSPYSAIDLFWESSSERPLNHELIVILSDLIKPIVQSVRAISQSSRS